MFDSLTRKVQIVMASLCVAHLVGCKIADNSAKTKSLNNFARSSGDVSRNTCSGNNQVVMGIKSEWDHVDFSRVAPNQVSTLKQTLKQSLSAVPANLQQLYFGLGGKIIFSTNLNASVRDESLTCQRSAANDQFTGEGTSRVDSCWVVDPKTNNVLILMNPSVESIQHSTVRVFGYILSQVLTKLSMDDKETIVRQDDAAFQRFLGDIAKAVVDDVQKPGSKYSFTINKSLLGTEEFKYFAFAESFDSYYCNAGLRASMGKKDEFPKTFALMQRLDQDLAAIGGAGSATARESGAAVASQGSMSQFNLGIFSGLFGGMANILGGLGKGIFNAAGGLLGGAGNLLGGVVNGAGNLLGAAGGGVTGLFQSLFGGG
jgi:hypothetical protein